jgi:hypothetical protein
LLAHLSNELRADLSHLIVVVFDGVKGIPESLWNYSLRPVGDPFEMVPVLDGHDSRHDGHRDACGADVADPVEKDVDVEEHLRDDEIGAGIDLLAQVSHLFFARDGLLVALRETSNGNVEVIAIAFADEAHEIDCVDKAVFDGCPIGGTARWVTTKRKYVAAARIVGVLKGKERIKNQSSTELVRQKD